MPSLVGGIPGSSSRLGGGLSAIGPRFVSDVTPIAAQRIPASLDQRVGRGAPVTYGYSGAGGIVFAGAAPVARVKAWTPAGGITFAGAALLARIRAWLASGGIVFGGAAVTVPPVGASTAVGEGVGLFWHPDRQAERRRLQQIEDDEEALVLVAAMTPYRRN